MPPPLFPPAFTFVLVFMAVLAFADQCNQQTKVGCATVRFPRNGSSCNHRKTGNEDLGLRCVRYAVTLSERIGSNLAIFDDVR